jgi:hypothetical protein
MLKIREQSANFLRSLKIVANPIIELRLHVSVEDRDDVDLSKYSFTWNVTSKHEENNQFDIQLYFENPEYISTSAHTEKLEISFDDSRFFVSKETGEQLRKTKFYVGLPRQLVDEGAVQQLCEKVAT